MADHGLRFSGSIYARNRNGDGGFFKLYNITSLTITPDMDQAQRTSRQKGSYGNALDNATTKNPTQISITGDTFNKQNFALLMMGDASDLNATSQQITDEQVTYTSGIIALKNSPVLASSVVITDSESNEVSADTYTVSEATGLIEPNDNWTATGALTVSYSTKAQTGYKVNADLLEQVELELKGDGENIVTGESIVLEIPHASVSSDGDFDFFSDDFNTFTLSGTLIRETDEPSTYTVKVAA